ncbi:MAG: DNA repair protein RecO [Deltaproteobacteria bacterium RIFCSPHIGHO2_02_FULL_40_11]|nr:MAG: DNA repair protein RecO [Deltaproteobacteria bacterium RIFCSPHIGHO2_02_FULL_40_11]
MQFKSTQAFIFEAVDFKDFDKRVVLLTKDFGKITAIALGAKKSQKRFGAALEPLTQVVASFVQKPHQSMVRLEECNIIQSYTTMKSDLERLSYGCYFLEVMATVMPQEEDASGQFSFLISFMKALEKTKNATALCRLFEARLLPMIGYEPVLKHCVKCERKIDLLENALQFSTVSGGIICQRCTNAKRIAQTLNISKDTVQYLRRMMAKEKGLSLNEKHIRELKQILPSFLFYHLDQEIKSFDFLENVIGNSKSI